MSKSSNNFALNITILAGLTLALAACNSTKNEGVVGALDIGSNQQQAKVEQVEEETQDLRAYCPKTVLRAGTETFRLYKRGVKKGDENARNSVRFQGSITEVVRECNYRGNTLNVRVGVAGRVINGPSGETGTFSMPLRIAVTRGEEVLYTQLHQVVGTIQPGKTNGFFKFVDGNIMIDKPKSKNIVIYAGFDEGPPKKK
ncbi:MAG: hypothetical protein COB78_07850 [Hyphomicrobiales bacterium]|nr:MAG: hypothetical protein COB78_07850 [Hyphomicrobiales bacterium]